MLSDPHTLLGSTLENLEALQVLLADELDERIHSQSELSLDARRCKEALLTIGVLIPKLKAAQGAELFNQHPGQLNLCMNCD